MTDYPQNYVAVMVMVIKGSSPYSHCAYREQFGTSSCSQHNIKQLNAKPKIEGETLFTPNSTFIHTYNYTP